MTPRLAQNRPLSASIPAEPARRKERERLTAHVNRQTAAQLDALIDEYWDVLVDSPLTESSREDYFYFAWAFSRWMKGEFTPGQRLSNDNST